MKRSNNFISTLIAMTATCAAAQCVHAQTPARQTFPWSSTAVAESAPSTVPQTASHVSASAQNYVASASQTVADSVNQSYRTTLGNATSISSSAFPVGETIYLDENGNQITREQMQAKISGVENLRQDFQNRVTPLQPANNSVWGKAKSVTSNVTSKAASFWKKPSLFKKPEGFTLPSTKTTWRKPKFTEPTTWFSKKTTDPITFAPQDGLPRRGKIPTSIDGPLTSPPAQFASQNSSPARFPSYQSQLNRVESSSHAIGKSILSTSDFEVAESVDNTFDLRR